MLRFSTLRHAAAALVFAASVSSALPAAAASLSPIESSYAAVLRHLNPHLPAAKAHAYARSVVKDATRAHLDPRFLMSIVTVESHWEAGAISRVGARGLGQLMPHTAALLGVNPKVASDNLRGTASYLHALLATFAGHKNQVQLAVASYNAGPEAVEKYHGIPPYAETQTYVQRVLSVFSALRNRVGKAFTPAHAVRTASLPEERQWVSGVEHILPVNGTVPATTDAAPPASAPRAMPIAPAAPTDPAN